MNWKYRTDETHKRVAMLGSALMAAVTVWLIFVTLFVWYPRFVP